MGETAPGTGQAAVKRYSLSVPFSSGRWVKQR